MRRAASEGGQAGRWLTDGPASSAAQGPAGRGPRRSRRPDGSRHRYPPAARPAEITPAPRPGRSRAAAAATADGGGEGFRGAGRFGSSSESSGPSSAMSLELAALRPPAGVGGGGRRLSKAEAEPAEGLPPPRRRSSWDALCAGMMCCTDAVKSIRKVNSIRKKRHG